MNSESFFEVSEGDWWQFAVYELKPDSPVSLKAKNYALFPKKLSDDIR